MTDPRLDGTENPENSVVIRRRLNADVSLVWKMWTDADLFASWYGPAGASIHSATIDAEVGGRRHICMSFHTPSGDRLMWFTGEHLVVEPNIKLVYTESLSDQKGRVLTHAETGLPAAHPLTTLVSVEFTAEESATTIVLTHQGIPPGSPGEVGWNMAFDKLVVLVGHAARP